MTRCQLLLVVHLVLLVLALTHFTIVTVFDDGQYQFELFQFSWQHGFGKAYEFPYSLPVVLTYMAAYSTGLVAFLMAFRHGSSAIGLAGMLVCALGCLSFAYELTHWLFDFYDSWIASAPIVSLILAPLAVAQEQRRRAELIDCHDRTPSANH